MADFADLTSQMPVGQGLHLDIEDESVHFVKEPNDRFVAPQLEVLRMTASPAVLLISAPAAVGKSTLATEIAQRTKNPIWDLSRFQVGNHFFIGTVARHFGPNKLGSVLQAFENGEAAVIMDAIDEAQLKAGPKNFDAFLDDLATAHGKPRPRPSLILLARPVTAALVATALELHDVPFSHYQVSYFGESAAKKLIDVYLDKSVGVGPHRTNRQPFEELREALFAKVFAALGMEKPDWTSERAQRFLGYAPVLAAMASFLEVQNVKNYQVALNQMKKAKVPRSLWSFLAELVQAVLERERRKTLEGIRPTLQPTADHLGWSKWDSLYGSAEQCARVNARVAGQSVEIPLPVDFPPALRGEYEDAIRAWFENHAFCRGDREFANVVFQDYVHAHALAHGPADLARLVRDELAAEALPGPLIGAFLLTIAPKSEATKYPIIDAQDVGALYDSMQSFARPTDVVSLELSITETAGIAVGLAQFPGVGEQPITEIPFEVVTGSKPVRFGQQLSNAFVDLETDVELGYAARPMTLGPTVVLVCRDLRMSASSYRVSTLKADDEDDLGGVTAIVESLSQSAIPDLKTFGDGALLVHSREDVSHPWAPYRKAVQPSTVPPDSWELFSKLRKILGHFRAHGKTEIARYADFVDNVLIGTTPLSRALMKVLLESGLLERRSHVYVLSRERMRDLGINHVDLRESRMTAGIAGILGRVENGRTRKN